uniref:Uncharacterized protein n=1 Tax=Mycena chlorophos TaxID=658473 RepID=A0ABQ0LKY9_MYCCL|nr:predicted protein [Mycena chlorophos]
MSTTSPTQANKLVQLLNLELPAFHQQQEVILERRKKGAQLPRKESGTRKLMEGNDMANFILAKEPSSKLARSYDGFVKAIDQGLFPPDPRQAGKQVMGMGMTQQKPIEANLLNRLGYLFSPYFTRAVTSRPGSEQDIRNGFFPMAVKVMHEIATIIPGLFGFNPSLHNVEVNAEANKPQRIILPAPDGSGAFTELEKDYPLGGELLQQELLEDEFLEDKLPEASLEQELADVEANAETDKTTYLAAHLKTIDYFSLSAEEQAQPLAYLMMGYLNLEIIRDLIKKNVLFSGKLASPDSQLEPIAEDSNNTTLRRSQRPKSTASGSAASSNATSPVYLSLKEKGMLAILVQVARYAHVYGSEFVFLTDYVNHMVFQFPTRENWFVKTNEAGHQDSETIIIEWLASQPLPLDMPKDKGRQRRTGTGSKTLKADRSDIASKSLAAEESQAVLKYPTRMLLAWALYRGGAAERTIKEALDQQISARLKGST